MTLIHSLKNIDSMEMLLVFFIVLYVLSLWCQCMLYEIEIAQLKKKIRKNTNARQDS